MRKKPKSIPKFNANERKSPTVKSGIERVPQKRLAFRRFKTEDAERAFWAKADTSDYFDLQKGEEVLFPNLKPSTESISLRLPKYLLAQIKTLANSKDVPYQSLMKMFLIERVRDELAALK